MLKKVITYEDYNGNSRTETFYFNLNKAELIELENGVTGGLTEMVHRISETQSTPEMMKIFKDIIFRSYGEKSDDGKRLIKSKELSEAFSQTDAYNVLFMELFSDADKVAEFIEGILPSDLIAEAQKQGLIDNKMNPTDHLPPANHK